MKALRSILAGVMSLALVACSINMAEIYDVGYTFTGAIGGDGGATNTLLGNSTVYKNSTAFKTFMQALGSMLSAYIIGDLGKVQEATKQMSNAGATQAQINASNNATRLASERIAAGENAEGVKAGVFKLGETIFKQK